MADAGIDKAADVRAAAFDLLVELAHEAGEALTHRIGQAGIIDHRGELFARGVDIAGQRIGSGKLGAGGGVIGLDREHALEGNDRLAEAPGIDRRDAERIVEGGIAGALADLARERAIIGLGLLARSLGGGGIGLGGLLRQHWLGDGCRRDDRGRPEHRCTQAECGNPFHSMPAPKFHVSGQQQWRRRRRGPTDKQCQGHDKCR